MKSSTNNGAQAPSGEPARQSFFDKLFARRWLTLIVSVLLAILLWLVVISQEPTQKIIVTGVPVSYDYNSPLYTGASLDIAESRDVRVNVTITCDTSAIGSVDKSDIIVYPDYTEVSGSGKPGTYSLRLRARRNDASLQKFEIDSISPAYLDVSFAQIGTQKFSVDIGVGVEAAEGYCLGEAHASPTEVTLRGPVEELERISSVRARVENGEALESTVLDSAPLEFLDKDGRVVETSGVTVQEGDQVEVTVPVLRVREVPLRFEYSNVPSGYDPEVLGARISPAVIRVAGSKETVEAIESVNAGFINLSRVQLGRPETLKIQLPEGLVNMDGVPEAIVTFDTSGYGEHTVTVSDIRVINAPSGVTAKAITEEIENVKLVGLTEELAGLLPADIVAIVDASTQKINVSGSGQQQFSAQIVVTGTKTVFATGAYSVLCDVTVSE